MAAKRGPHFNSIVFEEITTGYEMIIDFDPQGPVTIDLDNRTRKFASVEQAISAMRSDPYLSVFLFM